MEERITQERLAKEASEGNSPEDAGEGQKEKPDTGSAFEGIYDRMPDISVKALDRFILVCVIALIAVVLAGVLRANHVF